MHCNAHVVQSAVQSMCRAGPVTVVHCTVQFLVQFSVKGSVRLQFSGGQLTIPCSASVVQVV